MAGASPNRQDKQCSAQTRRDAIVGSGQGGSATGARYFRMVPEAAPCRWLGWTLSATRLRLTPSARFLRNSPLCLGKQIASELGTTRISHHDWTLLGGLPGRAGLQPRRNRGFRPLLVLCPAQSRRRGTARGAGYKNSQEGLVYFIPILFSTQEYGKLYWITACLESHLLTRSNQLTEIKSVSVRVKSSRFRSLLVCRVSTD